MGAWSYTAAAVLRRCETAAGCNASLRRFRHHVITHACVFPFAPPDPTQPKISMSICRAHARIRILPRDLVVRSTASSPYDGTAVSVERLVIPSMGWVRNALYSFIDFYIVTYTAFGDALLFSCPRWSGASASRRQDKIVEVFRQPLNRPNSVASPAGLYIPYLKPNTQGGKSQSTQRHLPRHLSDAVISHACSRRPPPAWVLATAPGQLPYVENWRNDFFSGVPLVLFSVSTGSCPAPHSPLPRPPEARRCSHLLWPLQLLKGSILALCHPLISAPNKVAGVQEEVGRMVCARFGDASGLVRAEDRKP